MEFVNMISELVQTVGFPIAICCYLLFDRRKSDEAHKEETQTLTDALNNNTIVLSRILECLHMEDDVE